MVLRERLIAERLIRCLAAAETRDKLKDARFFLRTGLFFVNEDDSPRAELAFDQASRIGCEMYVIASKLQGIVRLRRHRKYINDAKMTGFEVYTHARTKGVNLDYSRLV